jgi:hypothetical protein
MIKKILLKIGLMVAIGYAIYYYAGSVKIWNEIIIGLAACLIILLGYWIIQAEKEE